MDTDDLARARERAHILEGLVIALDNLDRVIAMIRAAADPAIARAELMEACKKIQDAGMIPIAFGGQDWQEKAGPSGPACTFR